MIIYELYTEVGGDQYLAMIMVMEHRPDGEEHQITPYSVEVQAIELTKIKLSDVPEGEIYNTTQWENASKSFTSGAKLLNGVEKSYDPGKPPVHKVGMGNSKYVKKIGNVKLVI